MAFLSIPNAKISGLSAVVPKQEVSNESIERLSAEERQLLIQTTGIDNRRQTYSLSSSDLCYEAANRLIKKLGWNREEIDVLIFVSQTPDQPIPGSAMQLQARLDLPKTCMALDVNQGCAGYVYGLSLISSLISQGQMTKGLLLVGDVITSRLDPDDMSTIPIFSDAGSATAIEFDESAENSVFNLQSDGSGADVIMQRPEDHMRMNGHEVFNFGLREVAPNLKALLQQSERSMDEIDYFVFHQANRLLNESIRRKLKLPTEKVPYSLNQFGNTSCATIPLTMVHNLQEELESGSTELALMGFGVGLSWGSALIRTNKITCLPLIELDEHES